MTERFIDTIMPDSKNISEIVSLIFSHNVIPDKNIDISALTAGDPDPMFINVEVIRANVLSKNDRVYSDNTVKQIAEFILGRQGFLGHPNPHERSFAFREPQCIFVGADVISIPARTIYGENNTLACIAKAYIFPSSKLREWIPKTIAANYPMAVSICGSGDSIKSGDYSVIDNITELESVDWANPGTQGFDTSVAISVVSEMKEEEEHTLNNNSNETRTIIENASLNEIKAYNSKVFTEMVKEFTAKDIAHLRPDIIEEITSTNVKEIKEKDIEIENLSKKIEEMEAAAKKLELDNFKSTLINEKIPENLREMVSNRINADTKEEISEMVENEIKFIKSITEIGNSDDNNNNAPVGRIKKEDMDDATKSIFKMFNLEVK